MSRQCMVSSRVASRPRLHRVQMTLKARQARSIDLGIQVRPLRVLPVLDADSYPVQILSEVIAFYENCTRVVLLRMEKLSIDGHIGEDTRLYCAVPHRVDGKTRSENASVPGSRPCASVLTKPIVFCFTLEVYSESGSLGIEHRAKYKPCPSNSQYPGQLGKFDSEFTFVADQIQPLFTELVGRFELF